MNDAGYVDYGPPVIPITSSPLWVAARPGQELYWAWNDPRWGAWGIRPETLRYQVSDQWEALLKQAGFQGAIYGNVKTGEVMNEYGGWDETYSLGLTDAAKGAIDTLRARGYDFRRKHPDRRTYNTYWGFFGPDGFIQDIKIEGDDGSANLLKAVLFTMPGWIGPLAGALSVPAPVLGTGIKLAAGADPMRTIVGAALPVVAETVLPSVSVMPDTSIGEILPADEWLTTGAALPTIDTGFMEPILPTIDAGSDIVAELLTAPELLPVIEPPSIEPDYLLRIDEPLVWDAADSWGPPIQAVELVEAPAAPVFEPEPLPVFEPIPVVELPTVALEPPPVIEPPRVAPPRRPFGKFSDIQESPVVEPPSWVEPPPSPIETFASIPMPVDVSTEAPPAFEPEPVQFEPAPVVELPAIETMAPIPTIDAAPPTIEPVEVFTQPPEVPAVYENEFLFNVDESSLFPEFEGPLLFDPYAGAEIPPVFIDQPFDVQIPEYGWGEPGEVYPPAYDVVTVDEASQLSTDILVGGNGGGVVEVGGNFLPNPNPADPGLSVGQILRDANAIMLDALKLVDSYRRLTNPQTPNRVAQARVGSSTVRATPGGMIETIDASGRVTRRKPPVGQPQMTTDGSMIVNNGDGTYTSISPSGAMSTNRYPADAGASGGYSTALLIGGAAVLAFAVLS